VAATLATFLSAAVPVDGRSLAGFIRALRHSLGHGHHHSQSRNGKAEVANVPEPQPSALNAPILPPSPPPIPPDPPPVEPQPSSAVNATNSGQKFPYGIPVPNREGFVTSPYAANRGLVDVRGFPSGTEVKDPYTGKVFLTP
jgi:hypothetical protein